MHAIKFLRFFVNTHLYVALGAVFLTLETQVQMGLRLQWQAYMSLIFFATLFDYNLHRLVTITTKKELLTSVKHQWVGKNRKLFYGMLVFSMLGLIVALTQTKIAVLIGMAPLALLTIFYTLPFVKQNKYFFRLRDIPLLKIFLIAFVWSVVTIYLPLISQEQTIYDDTVGFMLLERFLFIFAITIPCDIRDMKADTEDGIKTIPLLFGTRHSIRLANISIIIFFILCLFHYVGQNQIFLLPAYFLSALSTLYFINSDKIRQLSFYHYGVLDGTILLQGLLIVAASYFK